MGRGYPQKLREDAIVYTKTMLDKGHAIGAIAHDLGLFPETLRRWVQKGTQITEALESADIEGTNMPFVPVTVKESETMAALTIVTPTGYRLEGLDWSTAVKVIEVLS